MERIPRLAALARDGERRHVVICLINGMGDAFLALPVIRFVIESFGRERVTVWANGYHGKTVFAELGDVCVGTVESNRNNAAERKEKELAELRRHLPSGCALSWVSLNPYEPLTVVEEHAIASLGPRSLWRFRGWDLRIDHATRAVLHRMDQYFRVIGEISTPVVNREPEIGAVARLRAAAIRDQVHRMSKRLVAVHAQTRVYKCWPQSSWLELGSMLRNECELVILGLPAQVLSQASEYLTAPQGWEKQIAILAHSDAFVGVDSCFSHVADACNVPGLVLYSDADAAVQWRPKGPALTALIAKDGKLESLTAAEVAEGVRSRMGIGHASAGIESTSANGSRPTLRA